jgi:hypothetical protein
MALAPLSSRYLSINGSQIQDGPGHNVRLARAPFRGAPGEGSIAVFRAGLDTRDARSAGQTPTFDDEFTTAPWLTHGAWQSGDAWSFGATFAPTGLSEGPSWWANPITTTAAAPVYPGVPGGQLRLGLMHNPSGSGIGPTACRAAVTNAPIPCNTIGTIINNQQMPGGNAQLFGYYEFSAVVQSVPGFLFHWNAEDFPRSAAWTMEIDTDIWTNSDHSKHVRFTLAVLHQIVYETTSIDITQPHVYGINWQSDFITFYIDGAQVAQVANPGNTGDAAGSHNYLTQPAFTYFLTTDASYSPIGTSYGGGVNPANLPAFANIEYYRIYATKPEGG